VALQKAVNFISDGWGLTPAEFTKVLLDCTQTGQIQLDNYALGGVVEQMERKFAQMLGKDRALFLPTGTMANHIALRTLSEGQGKVIVQADSHIYRDIGDSAQTLSGLNLVPLGHGRVGFTLEEVQQTLESLVSERVATQIKAISIETPVRRQDDAMFGLEEIRRITDYARQRQIATHLDGARLFIEAVHTEVDPKQYADLFDTVFVSLSKCFNSASGAILAGPEDLIDNLYHTRRMFGGSLPQAWPQAVVALHYADEFLPAYRAAWQTAQSLFEQLNERDEFRVEHVPQGTHIVHLYVANADLSRFVEQLHGDGIHLMPVEPGTDYVTLKVNPSIHAASPVELAEAFITAAQATD
ncbi:uncharacterized protein METZ01_LOCUS146890, partial [marine metagenome]